MVRPIAQIRKQPRRAETLEELAPLFELCKQGKVYDVEDWIARGEPVNPPAEKPKRKKFRSPLLVAIDQGFHSLAEVLLKGGAIQEPDDVDSPMSLAISKRRRDLVELLVEHGFAPEKVEMTWVFGSWDPALMEYFIERGADIETDNPFAWAFCSQIRTALNAYKRYRERFPTLQAQANTGLRFHCKNGNMKWISLMLWAGADPYEPGPNDSSDTLSEDQEGISAVEYAAIYNHHDVFKLKPIRSKPAHPGLSGCVYSLGDEDGFDILKDFLARGLNPNDEEGKCSAIQSWLSGLDWVIPSWRWDEKPQKRDIDTEHARQNLKAIHLVAMHGGKWGPDEYDIKSARRSLLKMSPDYAAEFVWIMSKYKACRHDDIVALLNSPSMKRHISTHRERIDGLVASLDKLPSTELVSVRPSTG